MEIRAYVRGNGVLKELILEQYNTNILKPSAGGEGCLGT